MGRGSGVCFYRVEQSSVESADLPDSLGGQVDAGPEKDVAVQGVRRKRHGRIARVRGDPLPGGMQGILIEWLREGSGAIGDTEAQRNIPPVDRQVHIAGGEKVVRVAPEREAFGGIEYLVKREAAGERKQFLLADRLEVLRYRWNVCT